MARIIILILLIALLPCMHGCGEQKRETGLVPGKKTPEAASLGVKKVGSNVGPLKTNAEWALSQPEALAPAGPLEVATLPYEKYLALVAITGRFYNIGGCLVFLEGEVQGSRHQIYVPIFMGPVQVNVKDNPSVWMPSWKMVSGGRVRAARPIKLGEYVTLGGSLSNSEDLSTLPLVSSVSTKCAYPTLFIGGEIITPSPNLTANRLAPASPVSN